MAPGFSAHTKKRLLVIETTAVLNAVHNGSDLAQAATCIFFQLEGGLGKNPPKLQPSQLDDSPASSSVTSAPSALKRVTVFDTNSSSSAKHQAIGTLCSLDSSKSQTREWLCFEEKLC